MKKRDWMIKIIDAEDDEESEDEESDSDAPNYEEDYLLSMHRSVWQSLFDSIIDPIIGHCKKILSEKAMKDAKYIFLVGGFAKNKYFQKRMKKAFEAYKNCKVVIPGLPQLCVVDGAARYGLDQRFVKIRRMLRTYGIRITASKRSCLVNKKLFPKGYIEKNTYYNEKFKGDYVRHCFLAFVKKGDAVRLEDKPIVHELVKSTKDQTEVGITIYSSRKTNPMTTTKTDCEELGNVHVPLPKGKDEVMCEFTFSTNLLTVCAYPKGRPSQKKQCKVEYL